MSLHVLDAGLATRVVDLGRPHSRSLGVPVGGAADRAAFMLGNSLVGNAPSTPALEVCLKGPVLRAEARLGCVLFGAPLSIRSARRALVPGVTFTLEAGEEITIGGTREGMRAYLCVRGGLLVPEIVGSFSGLDPVVAEEVIPCGPSEIRQRFFPPTLLTTLDKDRRSLRVLPGLQADWFEEPAFYDRDYNVTPALDRMGVRLQGKPLKLPELELVSEPVCPGAIQATRDGQCIILGIDGQTIGGYPKIAQVIQADLDLLGQLRPGETIRFEKVGLAEAAALFRERQALLAQWCLRAAISLDGC